MTLHWTIISNELTQKFFCPIGTRRNSSVTREARTFVTMADILCYGVRYDKV